MDVASDHTRYATVALVGRPNVGKSTLLNAWVGEKLAITSPKPQATRQPVIGLHTSGGLQLIVVDEPGLLDPTYPMQRAMREAAVAWVRKADVVLYLSPADEPAPPPLDVLAPEFEAMSHPVALVFTKRDLGPPPTAPDGCDAVFEVSAAAGTGLEGLTSWCGAHARMGPFPYDPDNLSTQPARFFVSEFVREAAFEILGQELPYALAAEVDEFREGSDPLYIRVTVYVERESQRRMVIGKGGRTIKRLGQLARSKIEPLLGQRIYLDLWVKRWPKWRSKPAALAQFGITSPSGD